jgi:hypothetical protein
MAKRVGFLLVALLLVGGMAAVVFRTPRTGSVPQPGGAPDGQPAAGAGPARLLLNEVVFQPAAGEPPWVELVNAGGAPGTLDGVVLENQAGEKFALPSQLTLPAGGVMLVRFDGQTGTETNTVHAAPPTFLAAEGFIRMSGPQGQLDRIAWGDSQAAGVNLSRGGDQEALVPGTSLGRVPRTIASDPLEWVPYRPQQATPGQPNPQPGVEILLPMDGAIVTADPGDLTWYPVAGAARYRVQLAAEPSFATPLVDQTVEQPPVRTPALSPGSYVWRVQVIGADGAATAYSAPSTLTVRAARSPAGRGRALLNWLLPALHASTAEQPSIDDDLPTVLDIPMIKQHKDTAMLILETRRESAGRFGHSWDTDHGDLAIWDPADNANCAVASIAMLTAFYKGRLSQDRINYEVFKDDAPGPQGDLNWGRGYTDARKTRAMKFALGREPTIERPTDNLYTAAVVMARIASGTPMMGCKNGHCVAIVGASNDYVVINDPWRGTYLVPQRNVLGARLFVMANHEEPNSWRVTGRSDEPEVSRDSDGDGVVDFDEIHRFKTSPRLKDHDDDELPDKEDIRASVHDRRHGFAYGGPGRDFDGDGKAMELDADSDDGGCLDGWEDRNKNGKLDEGPDETDNFEQDDDPCIKGLYEVVVDTVDHGRGPEGQISSKMRQAGELSLQQQPDGTLRGLGSFSFTMWSEQHVPPSGCLSTAISPEPTRWTVRLEGTSKRSPDGVTEIAAKATPTKGPLHTFLWTNACPPGASGSDKAPIPYFFGFGPLKLKDGKFEVRTDTPPGPNLTGTQYTLLRLEQRTEAPRR